MDEISLLYEGIRKNSAVPTVGKVPGDTFKKPGESSKKVFAKNTGPENADGANLSVIETEGDKKTHYATKPLSQPKNKRKNVKESINNNSMKKNAFDKLYEDVMNEEQPDVKAADLDQVDAGSEPTEGDVENADVDQEGEDEEPAPLKDLIQQAIDALQQVAERLPEEDLGEVGGEEEGAGDEIEDLGGESEEGELDDVALNKELEALEATEMEELKGSNLGGPGKFVKDNKVKNKMPKPTGKQGDGKVTDKVGNEAGSDDVSKLQSKDNKVKTTATVGKQIGS